MKVKSIDIRALLLSGWICYSSITVYYLMLTEADPLRGVINFSAHHQGVIKIGGIVERYLCWQNFIKYYSYPKIMPVWITPWHQLA